MTWDTLSGSFLSPGKCSNQSLLVCPNRLKGKTLRGAVGLHTDCQNYTTLHSLFWYRTNDPANDRWMHFQAQDQSGQALQLENQGGWPADPKPLKPFVEPANKNFNGLLWNLLRSNTNHWKEWKLLLQLKLMKKNRLYTFWVVKPLLDLFRVFPL